MRSFSRLIFGVSSPPLIAFFKYWKLKQANEKIEGFIDCCLPKRWAAVSMQPLRIVGGILSVSWLTNGAVTANSYKSRCSLIWLVQYDPCWWIYGRNTSHVLGWPRNLPLAHYQGSVLLWTCFASFLKSTVNSKDTFIIRMDVVPAIRSFSSSWLLFGWFSHL
jgi:hypothetical protein